MRRMKLILLLLAGVTAAPLPAAAEGLTLDGDARAMTLVAEGVARSAVVAAISKRFAMQMSGMPISDDIVSGSFKGNLSDVLKKLLPDNGFVIAYNNGLPSRIVFTGKGSGMSQPGNGYVDPNTGMTPDPML